MNEGIHLDLDTWIVPGQIRYRNNNYYYNHTGVVDRSEVMLAALHMMRVSRQKQVRHEWCVCPQPQSHTDFCAWEQSGWLLVVVVLPIFKTYTHTGRGGILHT